MARQAKHIAPELFAKIKRRRLKGESLDTLAKLAGVSRPTLTRKLREAGVIPKQKPVEEKQPPLADLTPVKTQADQEEELRSKHENLIKTIEVQTKVVKRKVLKEY